MLGPLTYPTGVGGELVQRNEHLHPRTAFWALIDTSWMFLFIRLHEQHCTTTHICVRRRFQFAPNSLMCWAFQRGVADKLTIGAGKSERFLKAWICCFGQLRRVATSAVPTMSVILISNISSGSWIVIVFSSILCVSLCLLGVSRCLNATRVLC